MRLTTDSAYEQAKVKLEAAEQEHMAAMGALVAAERAADRAWTPWGRQRAADRALSLDGAARPARKAYRDAQADFAMHQWAHACNTAQDAHEAVVAAQAEGKPAEELKALLDAQDRALEAVHAAQLEVAMWAPRPKMPAQPQEEKA